MVSDERSYKCPSCRGVVAIPDRRRLLELDEVRAAHERTCPGRGVVIKEEESEPHEAT